MLTVRKVQGRSHMIAYLVLSSASLLLGIINLSLPTWLHYCWWDFGLFEASNTSRIADFASKSSISDLHQDACGSLQSYVERSCPDACDYLDYLSHAGYVMVVFGSVALASNAGGIVLVVLKLFKRRLRAEFNLIFIVPFVAWLLGFSVYAGVAHLGRFEGVKNEDRFNFDADDYSVKVGAAIAITLVLVYLAEAVYAWFVIRRFMISIK